MLRDTTCNNEEDKNENSFDLKYFGKSNIWELKLTLCARNASTVLIKLIHTIIESQGVEGTSGDQVQLPL